jgi:3-oxoacyl-[acyl-carrier-protein] synthase III
MNVPSPVPPKIWSDPRGFEVLGTGTALPGDPVTTADLLERLARRFGVDVRRRGHAVARRLGIRTRHVSRALEARFEGTEPGRGNAELAAAAVREALRDAGTSAAQLSYLIAHTVSPRELVPPTVVHVASLLDYHGPVVELRQACTGFANALVLARGLIDAGACLIAIVGSETGSVYFDPPRAREDRGQLVNLVQMGDGAAALILGPPRSDGGCLSHVFFGQRGHGLRPAFRLIGGGSAAPLLGLPEFEHDVALIREQGLPLLKQAAATAGQMGIDAKAVNYVLPHQANGRMDSLVGSLLGIPAASVFVNADRVGNTGSAAIWLAFAQLRRRLTRGQSVLALGAEAPGYMFGGFRYVHG